MKTPEEIKKGLDICTENDLCVHDACPYFELRKLGTCMESLMMDAVVYIRLLEKENAELEDHIGEITEKVQEWISIEDELPTNEGDYLICLEDGYIATAYFEDGDFAVWAEAGDIRYWMPLPKAPEVEANA